MWRSSSPSQGSEFLAISGLFGGATQIPAATQSHLHPTGLTQANFSSRGAIHVHIQKSAHFSFEHILSSTGTTGIGLGTTGIGIGTTGIGFGTTGIGFGTTGIGIGTTGIGFGITGIGFGTTGIGIGTTGIGFGTTGIGIGTTGIGFGTTGIGFGTTGIGFGTTGIGSTSGCLLHSLHCFDLTQAWLGFGFVIDSRIHFL